METTTFNCRFITPAFLGGASPKGTPELRPPSIKGALRFWWRAQSEISDLIALRKKESAIFGGIDGEIASKSSFSIRIIHKDFVFGNELPRSMTNVRDKTFKINIFEYLAFGIYEQKERKLNRDFIKQGEEFQISFIFRSNEFKKEIVFAFQLLSLLGGIGTKTRNGYGKFEILNDEYHIPNWNIALRKLREGSRKGFTSFSDKIICFQTRTVASNVEQALAKIGKAYKNAREYVENPHSFIYRSYIASPIVDKKSQESFLDRHAKPYFLTVVSENEGYRGLILFLPYLFLENAKSMMKELYNQKKKNPNSTGYRISDLEELLIHTPISKHQEYFVEFNGFFHRELTHNDNPNALTKITI